VSESCCCSLLAAACLAPFRYLLQPPAPHGRPFVITNKTITELHLALAKRASGYKVRMHTNTHVPASPAGQPLDMVLQAALQASD